MADRRTKATKLATRRAAVAPINPHERRDAVRAAATAWLDRMRSTFDDLHDMCFGIAREVRDSPDGDLARCLSADADQLFRIASDIASVDSELGATFIRPLDPIPNPLDAIAG